MIERSQHRSRTGTHRHQNLLERLGRSVAGGEHTRDRCPATLVDHDLAANGELNRVDEEFGVRQQPDLDEHTVELQLLDSVVGAVAVAQPDHPAAVADDLGRRRADLRDM